MDAEADLCIRFLYTAKYALVIVRLHLRGIAPRPLRERKGKTMEAEVCPSSCAPAASNTGQGISIELYGVSEKEVQPDDP